MTHLTATAGTEDGRMNAHEEEAVPPHILVATTRPNVCAFGAVSTGGSEPHKARPLHKTAGPGFNVSWADAAPLSTSFPLGAPTDAEHPECASSIAPASINAPLSVKGGPEASYANALADIDLQPDPAAFNKAPGIACQLLAAEAASEETAAQATTHPTNPSCVNSKSALLPESPQQVVARGNMGLQGTDASGTDGSVPVPSHEDKACARAFGVRPRSSYLTMCASRTLQLPSCRAIEKAESCFTSLLPGLDGSTIWATEVFLISNRRCWQERRLGLCYSSWKDCMPI